MRRWDDLEEFMRDRAAEDLSTGGPVRPCLVAFEGDRPLVLAYLRPFPQGEHADALIELLALACPLGADRLAVSFSGRAWSLDDPVVPVLGDADLRQRVFTVHGADGAEGPPRPFGLLWPFALADGAVRWGEVVRTDDADGWVPQALTAAVAARADITAADDEMARQASRCVQLGHDLYLSAEVEARLGVAGSSSRGGTC